MKSRKELFIKACQTIHNQYLDKEHGHIQSIGSCPLCKLTRDKTSHPIVDCDKCIFVSNPCTSQKSFPRSYTRGEKHFEFIINNAYHAVYSERRAYFYELLINKLKVLPLRAFHKDNLKELKSILEKCDIKANKKYPTK